jgi:hypothetical protein
VPGTDILQHLLLQNDRTALVEPNQVEGVLANVDPDRADGGQCISEMCASQAP